jgi:hypothetical protein
VDYVGTARDLPGWGKGVISGLTIIGGIVGGLGGGGIGGGVGFIGGLAAGPVAIVTGGGGAVLGAEWVRRSGVGSTAGAGAGAALGFAAVTLFEDASDLFQQATSSGGSGGGSPPNRIYSARVLNRSADDAGPNHNSRSPSTK